MNALFSIQKISLILLCIAIPYERSNLFGLGIPYLSTKLALIFLSFSIAINFFKIKYIKYKIYVSILSLFYIVLTIQNITFSNYLSAQILNISVLINILLLHVFVNTEVYLPGTVKECLKYFSYSVITVVILGKIGFSSYDITGRIVLLNLNANYIGLYICISMLNIFHNMFNCRQLITANNMVLIACSILLLQTLIETGSRVSVIILVIGCYFIIGLRKRSTNIQKFVMATFLALSFSLTWLYMVSNTVLGSRLVDTTVYIGEGARPMVWRKILKRIIYNNPLAGVGDTGYDLVMTRNPVLEGTVDSPHNVFIEVAAKTGLIGLALFVLFLSLVIKQCWTKYRKHGKVLQLIYMSAIMGYLFTAQVFEHKIMWLLFAYIIAEENTFKYLKTLKNVRN